MMIPGPTGKVSNYASQPVGMKPPAKIKPDKRNNIKDKNVKTSKKNSEPPVLDIKFKKKMHQMKTFLSSVSTR